MERRVNKLFIQLTIKIWDPTMVTFRFSNFEITPTLEEISQITNLSLVGQAPLTLLTTLVSSFLCSLGLIVGPKLRMVEIGWVSLGYLFKRYGRRESYDRFQIEFFFSIDWERHRAIILILAFLGIMVFLTRGNWININLLPMVVFMCRESARVKIVPMILKEIFQLLSMWFRGYTFSEDVIQCFKCGR